jgi:hypothetical protein
MLTCDIKEVKDGRIVGKDGLSFSEYERKRDALLYELSLARKDFREGRISAQTDIDKILRDLELLRNEYHTSDSVLSKDSQRLTAEQFIHYLQEGIIQLVDDIKEIKKGQKIKIKHNSGTPDVVEITDSALSKDSLNYLGEKEYQTYEAWKATCKKINSNVQFEGDKDICQAKPGIGEWDGAKGVIYTKDSALSDLFGGALDPLLEVTEKEAKDCSGTKDAPGDSSTYKGYIIKEESDGFHVRWLGGLRGSSKEISTCRSMIEAKGEIDKVTTTDGGPGSGQKGHTTSGGAKRIAVSRGKWSLKRTGTATQKARFDRLMKKMTVRRGDKWSKDSALSFTSEEAQKIDPFTGLVIDDKVKQLIALFSSDKKIEDHRDIHSIAEALGIEPSELEDVVYSLLQSFFSNGKFATQGDITKIDQKEIALGDKVEREHTDNPIIARRIALDHLAEIPDYYSRLSLMESAAKEGIKSTTDLLDLRKPSVKGVKDGGEGSGKKGHVTAEQRNGEPIKGGYRWQVILRKILKLENKNNLSPENKMRLKELRENFKKEENKNEKKNPRWSDSLSFTTEEA